MSYWEALWCGRGSDVTMLGGTTEMIMTRPRSGSFERFIFMFVYLIRLYVYYDVV